MTFRLDIKDAGFEQAFADLLLTKRETDSDVNDTVSAILGDVRERGDVARTVRIELIQSFRDLPYGIRVRRGGRGLQFLFQS